MESRTVPPSSDFTLVYTAAKDANTNALDGFVHNGICIDVRDERGLFTPAARLAAEGNDEAVELLKQYGANINPIAMGYASIGRLEKAEDLRTKFGASIWHLVVGSAMHSDHTYSDLLQAKYDLRAEWLIYGASLGGHHEYATLKMPQRVDEKQYEKAICAKVKGFILRGETDKALVVLEEHQNDPSDILLRTAIEAAARMKNDEFLGKIITRNGTKPLLLQYYYDIAADGAAKGGHIEYAASLLKMSSCDKKTLEQVAISGIRHGHYHDVQKHFYFLTDAVVLKGAICGFHHALREQAESTNTFSGDTWNDSAVSLARFGFVADAADLYDKYRGVVPVDLVKAMDQGGYLYNEKLLQHALASVKSKQFHDAMNDAALVLSSDPSPVQSSGKFKNPCYSSFRDCNLEAMKIVESMQKFHFDVDQAAAYVRCNDLRFCLEDLAQNPDVTPQQFAANIEAGKFDLSSNQLETIAEKYKLYLAKTFVCDELEAYCSRHQFSFWQHSNRMASLGKACTDAGSRAELKTLFSHQMGLFSGTIKPAADNNKPKYLQPLKNPVSGQDDCYQTVAKILNDNRLK